MFHNGVGFGRMDGDAYMEALYVRRSCGDSAALRSPFVECLPPSIFTSALSRRSTPGSAHDSGVCRRNALIFRS